MTHLNDAQRAQVILKPLGDKIYYELKQSIYCQRNQGFLPHSNTYGVTDSIWSDVFKAPEEKHRFLQKGEVIEKIIPISYLGYEDCDHLK